jgi:hypothetical protein
LQTVPGIISTTEQLEAAERRMHDARSALFSYYISHYIEKQWCPELAVVLDLSMAVRRATDEYMKIASGRISEHLSE